MHAVEVEARRFRPEVGERARFAGYNTGPGLRTDIEIPAEFAS